MQRVVSILIVIFIIVIPSVSLGKNPVLKPKVLSALALSRYKSGNYSEAIRFESLSLAIRKQNPKYNTDYATSFYNLASYYLAARSYVDAIRIGNEAMSVYERVYGMESSQYADLLNNLAYYNSNFGNFTESINIGEEALAIYERVLGKDNPSYANSLANLAFYHDNKGDFPDAVRLGTEAAEIYEKLSGKASQEYSNALNNVAKYYSDLGNYTEALRLCTEVLEIQEKVLGKNNPLYFNSLNNIANYYSFSGNHAEAFRLENEALKICERVLGKNNTTYASILNDLAVFCAASGDYDEAIRLGVDALSISERISNQSSFYANSLTTLANFRAASNNYNEAIRLCTKALEIRRCLLGANHIDCVSSLESLALYCMYGNRYGESADYAIETTKIRNEIIRTTFADMTANERTLFWNQYKSWYEANLPKLAFYIQSDSLTAATYEGTLLGKGLLLNSEMEMTKLIAESGDAAVVEKYLELKSSRALFNKMIEERYAELQTIADISEKKRRETEINAKIDSLERRLQVREQDLVQESKAYGDYTKNLAIDWKQVQEKLGEKDVAIEFLSFPVQNDSIMYVALTLTKEDKVPQMTPLFEKSELDGIAVDEYYNTRELARLVWKPLKGVIEEKKNIYFAPAGNLHNIAIESLPCYDGSGLMSDRWNLYRLSSTRELAVAKNKIEVTDAYLYGNLKYDTDVKILIADAGRYTGISRDFDWETVNIADTLTSRGAIQSMLSSLPATKDEVESIDRTLRECNINTTLLTDTLGTEMSVKALSGRFTNLLHIATHGFYWKESEAKNMDLGLMGFLKDNSQTKYTEDMALTRSGLCFAGAEQTLKKEKLPANVDDGILTAKEISVLDLRGLDLVVLSACETGLGEITGDGVFGLQRGFKKAGANTLLMSLWKVDDDATKMLMSEFYSNLAKGEGKFTALKDAQKGVRTYNSGQYSDPKYWAAFILLDADN